MAIEHIPKFNSNWKNLHYAIYYYYTTILDSSPKLHWHRRGGIIVLIRIALELAPFQRWLVKHTLTEIMQCMIDREDLDGVTMQE